MITTIHADFALLPSSKRVLASLFLALALGACVSEPASNAAVPAASAPAHNGAEATTQDAKSWSTSTDASLLARTCAAWVFDGKASSSVLKSGYRQQSSIEDYSFIKEGSVGMLEQRTIEINLNQKSTRRNCVIHMWTPTAPGDDRVNGYATMKALEAEAKRRGYQPELTQLAPGVAMGTGNFVKAGKVVRLSGSIYGDGRTTFSIREME